MKPYAGIGRPMYRTFLASRVGMSMQPVSATTPSSIATTGMSRRSVLSAPRSAAPSCPSISSLMNETRLAVMSGSVSIATSFNATALPSRPTARSDRRTDVAPRLSKSRATVTNRVPIRGTHGQRRDIFHQTGVACQKLKRPRVRCKAHLTRAMARKIQAAACDVGPDVDGRAGPIQMWKNPVFQRLQPVSFVLTVKKPRNTDRIERKTRQLRKATRIFC